MTWCDEGRHVTEEEQEQDGKKNNDGKEQW
jgi:hypothetical protein